MIFSLDPGLPFPAAAPPLRCLCEDRKNVGQERKSGKLGGRNYCKVRWSICEILRKINGPAIKSLVLCLCDACRGIFPLFGREEVIPSPLTNPLSQTPSSVGITKRGRGPESEAFFFALGIPLPRKPQDDDSSFPARKEYLV